MKSMREFLVALVCGPLAVALVFPSASVAQVRARPNIDLPTSKRILEPVPGDPARLNGLPMAFAWSPDGRYLAAINGGYGTFESNYQQSIAILDTATGRLTDFPDARTGIHAHQILYQGLVFSPDGAHLYASLDSLSDPEGQKEGDTGNAIAVYSFTGGAIEPERVIPVPLQRLAPDHGQNHIGAVVPAGMAIPAPTAIAVVNRPAGEDRLLVADVFSDDVLLLDAATGKTVFRYDLAANPVVPSTYPIALAVSRDSRRAFVALWNGSAVVELDLRTGAIVQKLALLPPAPPLGPSSHPAALALSPDQVILYVALANRDTVAVVNVAAPHMRLTALLDTRLPGQAGFGAMPDALVMSPDGARLYVANTGSDSVAVFSTRTALARRSPAAPTLPLGFLPTEWYPSALAVNQNHLYVATAKGRGTGPNVDPERVVTGDESRSAHSAHTYIATLLYGSLATIDRTAIEPNLKQLTADAVASNRVSAARQPILFHAGANPIRHLIYIIKENRTYDQIFGDLGVGDGDPSLTMYGRSITPNLHKLAVQFGILDNFYDSGEVSGDGHVWSTAGITSDYTEKTWQQGYRGSERPYDSEGITEEGYPLKEGIPDIDEPNSNYLWTNLARHDKTLIHFGEFISTRFCDNSDDGPKPSASPLPDRAEPSPAPCPRDFIRKGEAIPANYGGGVSPYPWPIPLIAENIATKPELVGHFDPLYPDFNLNFPDQLRFEEFRTRFRRWQTDRAAGHDTMPTFVMLRLPNDHTAGTRPGSPRPAASVADNDLAVGRAVEVVSASAYWDDTAFFILEDDAQDGADHVDAHRSIALVVSKFSPRAQSPVIDHHFYTTVSFIRTMEDLLGLPPMNLNDEFAPPIAPLFAGEGDQPPYTADYSNRDNGLIYQANSPRSPGARESSRMDFTHEDRADPRKLNVILWKDAMGKHPMPYILLHPRAGPPDHDD